MKGWLTALTDFGDLAVLMPVAAAMLIWLPFYSSRAALSWVLARGFCVGLTALLKRSFMGVRLSATCTAQAGTRASGTGYGALTLATASPGLRRLLVIGSGAGLVW